MSNKSRRKKSFKCVYCDTPIKYEGSCEACGYKEDKALGKLGEPIVTENYTERNIKMEKHIRKILEDTGTIDIDLALSQILKLTLLNEVKKLSFKEGDIILCKDIELNKQLARLKLPENFPKIPIVLVKDFRVI